MYEDRCWWTRKDSHEVRCEKQWGQYEKGEREALVRAGRNHDGKDERVHPIDVGPMSIY